VVAPSSIPARGLGHERSVRQRRVIWKVNNRRARDHPKGRTDETTMNPIIRISDITPLVNLWRKVGGKTLLRER
jgi:hypothetical protein